MASLTTSNLEAQFKLLNSNEIHGTAAQKPSVQTQFFCLLSVNSPPKFMAYRIRNFWDKMYWNSGLHFSSIRGGVTLEKWSEIVQWSGKLNWRRAELWISTWDGVRNYFMVTQGKRGSHSKKRSAQVVPSKDHCWLNELQLVSISIHILLSNLRQILFIP